MKNATVTLSLDTMRNAYIQSNFKDVANATFTAWAVVGRDDLAVVTSNITWEYESGGSPTTVKQLIVLRLHQDERWLIQSVIFNSSE